MSDRLWSAWRGWQGAAAVGVLLTMAISHGIVLAGSWFSGYDLGQMGRAAGTDLASTVSLDGGPVLPQLSYWFLTQLAPLDWRVVVACTVVVQISTAALVWLLLTHMVGKRWSRVVLLAVFAWTPMMLTGTLSMEAVMGLWPPLLCAVLAAWLLVRRQEHDARRWWDVPSVVAATAFGLLWHERALLIPILLVLVATLVVVPAAGQRRAVAVLARWRWLWVAVAALVVALLVSRRLAGREGSDVGDLLALGEFAWSSVVLVAVIVLAAGVRRGVGSDRLPVPRLVRRHHGVAVAGLLVLVALTALVTTGVVAPAVQDDDARSFVTDLRRGVAADPNVVLVDRPAPEDVAGAAGPRSWLSTILAPLPESLRFDETSPVLRQVEDDGRLRSPRLGAPTTVDIGDESCGVTVSRAAGTLRFEVPLDGRQIVHLGYFSQFESTVEVRSGSWRTEFLAGRGPREVWLVVPDLPGEVERLVLRGDGRSTVCIVAAEAGGPEQ